MTTISDEGDKSCPLCAEEMDLTDQQLKPCKCGYEICVWCWHHIMEMAEKDDLEGRCPACRTPYDKGRIVGMAANCERVVAEINAEKKNKSQKAKSKASIEARKHLNGVRVVKRNLVYITGLPSNLADESILERKEYFGQYGKVLKVSISRTTSTTAAQQANSNTFGVYITFAREEEAIRCIQAVHSFTLEGKPLRACFGTTKYCHSWLRNMTCSNPDCLYLHDVGSQEDSFTKDEIISAYTRGRVPQGASNSLQRCSGNILPPPLDDWCSDGAISGRNIQKSASNNAASQVKCSPNLSSDGRSTVLPAAASWGSRVSNLRPQATTMVQNQVKQKAEIPNSSCSLSLKVASTTQTSAWHDDSTISKTPEGRSPMHMNYKPKPLESGKHCSGRDSQITASDMSNLDANLSSVVSAWNDDLTTMNMPEGLHMRGRSQHLQPLRPSISGDNLTSVVDEACPSAWDDDLVTTPQIQSETTKPVINKDCQASASSNSSTHMKASPTSGLSVSCSSGHQFSAPENKDEGIAVCGDITNTANNLFRDGSYRRSNSILDKVSNTVITEGNLKSLCSGLASANIASHTGVDHPSMDQQSGLLGNFASNLRQYCPEQGVDCSSSTSSSKNSLTSDLHVLGGTPSDFQGHIIAPTGNVTRDASVAYDDQRHNLSHLTNESSCLSVEYNPLNISNHPSSSFWNNEVGKMLTSSVYGDPRNVDKEVGKDLLSLNKNGYAVPNAFEENLSSSGNLRKVFEGSGMNNSGKGVKYFGRSDELPTIGKTTSVDTGESSIITDILSLDFDPWDDSSSTSNNFAKLLGEMDKQDGSSKLSSSWKSQHSNQSRFSFAQQDNQANVLDTYFRSTDKAYKINSSSQDPYGDCFQNGSQVNSFEASNSLVSRDSAISSDTTAGVSRPKTLVPPGFRLLNRAPPPGFSSHDRYGRQQEAFSTSDYHPVGNSPTLNQYQVHSVGNNPGDVEFIDPAILAVGKGILPISVNSSILGSRFPSFTPSGSDPRSQLKHQQQQYISTHQDPWIQDHRYIPPPNDAYLSPGHLTQNHRRHPQFTQALPHHQQQPRTSHVSNNSQWDGWNDVLSGSDTGMGEMFRNNRYGL